MELTPAEKRTLKARAHHLRPVVILGDAGLTDAVLREIDVHLKSHGLIKVRTAAEDRTARQTDSSAICSALDAALVQHIGRILVLYRPRPEDNQETAKPKRPARKAPRRTKRSFQME